MTSSKQAKILIVDDNINNIKLVDRILTKKGYQTSSAASGLQAIKKLKTESIDLVLLDIEMPELDGFSTCVMMKHDHTLAKIPVIFLTAKHEVKDITNGFEVGGVDFVQKPFSAPELLARVNTQVELKLLRDDLEIKVASETEMRLAELRQHEMEMAETEKEVIEIMGAIAEARSKETGLHVKRVAEFSAKLALLYGLDKEKAELIRLASPLHDIGKVGIADAILNKPGKLTKDEFEIMKTHAELGYQMLSVSKKPVIKAGRLIAASHHEKWNGNGYPLGQKGEEIPIEGRITAIADVFDALGAIRVYKPAWPLDKIRSLFEEEQGKHFDPQLTKLFLDHFDEFVALRDLYIDQPPEY